jgi:exopolyphosphatase/guanosine-5'-triphosphate,3'-diphosphate pyrophosphatase
VAQAARALYAMAVARPSPESLQRVEWAGQLHEIGYTVSHQGFHKHSAYILSNADMPGFSAREQQMLAVLVLACRGGLAKAEALLADADTRAQILALRVAVLLHHARIPIDMPRIDLRMRETVRWKIARRWLARHPLTSHLLEHERGEWTALGYPWRALAATSRAKPRTR